MTPIINRLRQTPVLILFQIVFLCVRLARFCFTAKPKQRYLLNHVKGVGHHQKEFDKNFKDLSSFKRLENQF